MKHEDFENVVSEDVVENNDVEVADTGADQVPVSKAVIVITDDGIQLIDDGADVEGVHLAKDGLSYVLPKNSANRTYIMVSKIDKAREEGVTEIPLEYRATKHFGSVGTHIPNEKLISYLSPELQEEYKAIIARAQEAKAADKAKPKTELERAQEKLEKAKAAYAALLAQAGKTDEEIAELTEVKDNG